MSIYYKVLRNHTFYHRLGADEHIFKGDKIQRQSLINMLTIHNLGMLEDLKVVSRIYKHGEIS